MKKYGKGFVSKDRGIWKAVLSWTEEDGSKHRTSRSTGIKCSMKKGDNRGKTFAENFLNEWRDGLVRDEEKKESERRNAESQTPLAQYCKSYIDYLHVKPSTMTGYLAGYRKMLGTPMGDKPIGEVTADDVRLWEQGMREDGLSETTIAHYHALLAQVMKSAILEGKIEKNPLLSVKPPRRRFKPVNSLNADQRKEVLDTMRVIGNRPLALAVRIALLTGMRRGEICALRWQDIDIDGHSIHVVHGLTKGKGFKLDTPKDPSGGDSTRFIPIGNILAQYLREHKEGQVRDLGEMGLKWSSSLFVLGDPFTGQFLNPETLGREWRMLVQAMGWRGSQGEYVRFHDLRHTFATLVIAEKVMDVMALSKILGHRDASMTLNVYSDALEETKRSGMEALDLVIAGTGAGQTRRAKHMRASV